MSNVRHHAVFAPAAVATDRRADEWHERTQPDFDVWERSGADFHSAYNDFIAAAHPFVRDFHTINVGAAEHLVLNHAINDVLDLLHDCISCHGRDAARAARALFEHAVNFADVTTSPSQAKRYLDHEAVTAELLGLRQPGLERLSGRARQREAKRYARMAKSATPRVAAAIKKYRSSFRRAWSASSLYDRAVKAGMASDYDAYRILSGVLHGNSGGLLGTRRLVGGRAVHRAGPDMKLASLAWLEGLTFFHAFLGHVLKTREQNLSAQRLQAATTLLLDQWPTLHETLRTMDDELWPKEPIPAPMAVLGFFPSGVRWYYHDLELGAITVADPPADAAEQETKARELMAGQLESYRPDAFGGRPMTVAMLGVSVQPKPGAPWVPAKQILVPTDEYPRPV